MKNHCGKYECRLCLTLHSNEGSYLAHTQGKRHQTHLAKRAARNTEKPVLNYPERELENQNTHKIGRPGYRVTKQFDAEQKQRSLLFQIYYPAIDEMNTPEYRLMSTFEQRKQPTDRKYQYVLFAANDYEVIAFKIRCNEIIRPEQSDEIYSTTNYSGIPAAEKTLFAFWDSERKIFSLQINLKGHV